jgi:hypothetical protein
MASHKGRVQSVEFYEPIFFVVSVSHSPATAEIKRVADRALVAERHAMWRPPDSIPTSNQEAK